MLQNNSKLYLTTDASNIAIGAVLEQKIDSKTSPLDFFSQKLKSEETKYSTYDRELLAVTISIKHFRHILENILEKHRP
jgi:menaquinone-dependent protoporphyrinogen IX oxidase